MRMRVGLLIGLVGAGVAGCGSPREAPPAAPPPADPVLGRGLLQELRVLRRVVLGRRHEDSGLVQPLGHLERLRDPRRGRRAPAADELDDRRRSSRASSFPSDGRILYTSDEGGNELSHVYVRAEDGTTKDLTPGKKLNASFFGWADDDKSFFVASNERDQRYFDVYEYAADGYARTLFYRNTDGFELGPISRDKRYLALGKSRTTNDSDIWLIDRKTRTKKNITAHQGDVSNQASDFSPDGTTLLFISDAGREFKSLRSLRSRHRPAEGRSWSPTGTSGAPPTRRAASTSTVWINEDAAYTTRLYEAPR